jgi:hypothetical protein
MRARPFVMVLALVLGAASIALADANQRPAVPSGGCGALIMWYICSSRKSKEIGGWLLYYYIQLYLGLILSLILTAVSLKNYLPSSWEAAPGLYLWFLASTVPGILLLPIQLVVAETLRLTRNPKFIRILLTILWADLALSLLAAAIDLKFFEDNIAFDVIGVVWPLIWIPYFNRSQRVRRVFVSKDWLTQGPAAA